MGSVETPPQAWGRLLVADCDTEPDGNTPTGVGKTAYKAADKGIGQKHPHRRGEDLITQFSVNKRVETPPQAWGRLFFNQSVLAKFGNTPTGVGKTQVWRGNPCGSRKHPHRRGEDSASSLADTCCKETPPQAWGRLWSIKSTSLADRNTPTGVGKTAADRLGDASSKKHPHRRGEDQFGFELPRLLEETPPQAWGRRLTDQPLNGHGRNTPTGVGKTATALQNTPLNQKHPHRRGEDHPRRSVSAGRTETPPQAWGRQILTYC